MVERLAFLRRLKLLRNVPIEELATFSHIVGTAIVANRQQQVLSNNSNRMHIIVEGECTMHLNRYSSSFASAAASASASASGAAGAGAVAAAGARDGKPRPAGARDESSAPSAARGDSGGGAREGVKFSSDNGTVIARFGPGCVFWETSVFKDLRHEWTSDWHVVIRSPTLKMFTVHRNDWLSAAPDGAPIVSEGIKRSFFEEARFKHHYYSARARNIAEKVRGSPRTTPAERFRPSDGTR